MRRKIVIILSLVAGAGSLVSFASYFAVKAIHSQIEHTYVAFDVSPNGREVVFSAADAHLYQLELQTQQVRQLTRGSGLETEPAFSPDNQSLVYASHAKDGDAAKICIRSLRSGETRELTHGSTTFDTMPSFSSDGKRITFMRAARHRPYSMGGWTWDNYDVYVMNRDGSGLHRVTRQNYSQANRPHFLNNGREIVFAGSGEYPNMHTYLFTAPIGGVQPPTKLMQPTVSLSTNGASPAYCAAWGSDPHTTLNSKQVVFISDRAESYKYDVWATDANGGKPRALGMTRISTYNQEPMFTPDGDHILFLAGTEQNASSRPIFSLWEVDKDGSNAHQLAGSNLFTDPLHWKP